MLDFNHGTTRPASKAGDLTERINAHVDKALQGRFVGGVGHGTTNGGT